jgi:hypothetical protein
MKQFEWALGLTGSQFDLEDAVALFGDQSDPSVHVLDAEASGDFKTILTSPQMDELSAARQVYGVANRLLSLVNGALFVLDPAREPLKGGGLRKRHADGKLTHFLIAQSGTIANRTRFGRHIICKVGEQPPTQPPPAPVKWVAAAQSDQIVADVLTYLSGEPSWFDLYKAFEMMRDDINQGLGGQHRQERMGWPKKPVLDHFTLSAQVYRHAPPWEGGYTPAKAMPVIDARRFLQSLTSSWLRWRLG